MESGEGEREKVREKKEEATDGHPFVDRKFKLGQRAATFNLEPSSTQTLRSLRRNNSP